MRIPILAFMVCASAYAADGYVKQVSLADIQNEKPKVGDVYKIRQFRFDDAVPDGGRYTVELYSDVKAQERTLELVLTEPQYRRLVLSANRAGNLFLRWESSGWVFLGTEIYRDRNGKTGYR